MLPFSDAHVPKDNYRQFLLSIVGTLVRGRRRTVALHSPVSDDETVSVARCFVRWSVNIFLYNFISLLSNLSLRGGNSLSSFGFQGQDLPVSVFISRQLSNLSTLLIVSLIIRNKKKIVQQCLHHNNRRAPHTQKSFA